MLQKRGADVGDPHAVLDDRRRRIVEAAGAGRHVTSLHQLDGTDQVVPVHFKYVTERINATLRKAYPGGAIRSGALLFPSMPPLR